MSPIGLFLDSHPPHPFFIQMNPATEADALNLANGFVALLGEMEDTCAMDEVEGCTEVVLFPPFPFISKVKDVVGKAGISVGSQQVYYEDKGAFTGSVAASMVKSVGCEYVLCGHSERRTLFSDDDVNINAKVKKTLEFDMKPILCIGETKEEFDLGITKEVCAMQVSKDLAGVSKADMANVVIACEFSPSLVCIIYHAILSVVKQFSTTQFYR
jgi:triosephosphate isomerase